VNRWLEFIATDLCDGAVLGSHTSPPSPRPPPPTPSSPNLPRHYNLTTPSTNRRVGTRRRANDFTYVTAGEQESGAGVAQYQGQG
jgi:hypothetical protein